MRPAWLVILASGLCALSSGVRSLALQEQTQTPASAAAQTAPTLDGATLFKERGCPQCHQIHGVGGHKGPDLSGIGRRWKPEAIQHQIEVGGGAMPAFGEALPPEEITALVEYLHRCREKPAK